MARILRRDGGSYFDDARVRRAFVGSGHGEAITAAFIRSKGPKEAARHLLGALVEKTESTMRTVGKRMKGAAAPRHPAAAARAEVDAAVEFALRIFGVPLEDTARLAQEVVAASLREVVAASLRRHLPCSGIGNG